MESNSLRSIQEEIIDLEERIERTQLRRIAPPIGMAIFVAFSILPFGPGSKPLGDAGTLAFFVGFSLVVFGLVVANEVLAARKVRDLESQRSERFLALQRCQPVAGPEGDS